jgi:hypothetical protein
VLLLDLNFQAIDWRAQIARGRWTTTGARRRGSVFSAEQAMPLVREILTEAWSIARSMPRAANLVFGMGPAVSAVIARLPASDSDRAVPGCSQHLRSRWEERPGFWTSLLDAALGMDDKALANVHLHSLQLLGTELLLPYN